MNTLTLRRIGGKILAAIALTLVTLVTAVGLLGFFSATWYIRVYGRTGFDSVIYTLTGGLGGLSRELLNSFLTGAALPTLLCTAGLTALILLPWKKWKLSFLRPVAAMSAVLLAAGLIFLGAQEVGMLDYLSANNTFSELYQDYYRDPEEVSIQFPKEKRNLIYIMLESMETSYLDKANGGGVSTNLIPELQQLAQENINFSHNEYVGGFREVSGASWTIGAMVAHTSGVPLKVPEGITDWQNGYGTDGTFLPGLANLHTILAENGYNQALMVGSDATFGGRKTYYETHGINKVYDYYTARDEDRIFDPYHFVWWGYEDHILFDYAKTKITEMAAGDQPFAFTMLTVDTHHIGGYKCTYCGNDHEENYENVIACASRQVAAFVAWLQEQPFYENTTIIITGDHCSMDNGYFSRNVDADYTRHIYNCFINSAVDATYTQNRSFSALDMFPTTLAAMGCTIDGNRLGLGVNLFSYQPTLMELMGFEAFNEELAKRSEYYASNFYTAK